MKVYSKNNDAYVLQQRIYISINIKSPYQRLRVETIAVMHSEINNVMRRC